MLFTRTIQRTLAWGLAMVLIMMIGLSLSALYGHFSLRHIIADLDFAFNEIPRKQDLVGALVRLEAPLLENIPATPEAVRQVQADFRKQLDLAVIEADAFIAKLSRLPPSPEFEQAKVASRTSTDEIQDRLRLCAKESAKLADVDTYARARYSLMIELDFLQMRAQHIPDIPRGIQDTFRDARGLFSRGLWLVLGSAATSLLLFTWLILFVNGWVLSPLRTLHQGARRVAQGDFNYRLELPRQDEMHELADAFNSMTARFQEIATDLDQQVAERIKQLIRSERLAGIGFLAAGVAHEINNPLSAIAMASESLAERFADESPAADSDNATVARQYLQMIEREAFRCQRITRKLLDFARGNGDACGQHDLTAIVNDVLGVMRHMSRYADRTIRFARSGPCFVQINGPEIQQVIMNLVSNGLEAMDGGGTMTIDISEQTDHVTLSFCDDGCGMSQETLDNLFEPFFTQRRDGKGTGLGLSISHRIVADHGGAIQVESAGVSCGSTFRVRLPRRAAQKQAAAA